MLAVRNGELCTVVVLVFVFEAAKNLSSTLFWERSGRTKIDRITAAAEKSPRGAE